MLKFIMIYWWINTQEFNPDILLNNSCFYVNFQKTYKQLSLTCKRIKIFKSSLTDI